MRLMRKQDGSLLDIDDITTQVSTARPVVCKSKETLQGECCCPEHCDLAMHISSQVKLAIYEKEAVEMREELIKYG
jgi:hypothetical protein